MPRSPSRPRLAVDLRALGAGADRDRRLHARAVARARAAPSLRDRGHGPQDAALRGRARGGRDRDRDRVGTARRDLAADRPAAPSPAGETSTSSGPRSRHCPGAARCRASSPSTTSPRCCCPRCTASRCAGACCRSCAAASRRPGGAHRLPGHGARSRFPLSPERRQAAGPLPGIDAEFRPGEAAAIARTRAGLGSPEGYLLYAGTLEPRKGVGLLLDAWSALRARDPRTPPLVLGGGDGWKSADLTPASRRCAPTA